MDTQDESRVGPIYVNSVSGPKMYEFMEGGWDVYRPQGVVLDRKAENTQFFQVIRIEGASLVYKAYMANGDLYDAFELRKEKDGSRSMRDWAQIWARNEYTEIRYRTVGKAFKEFLFSQ